MKNISFFLSSTFNDMQSERDLIREFIAPEVEEYAKKFGYNCEFIDLRWGIDTRDMTENDANRKILNTCFDEIRNSRPFFIGLLGERYGWVPDPEEVACAMNGAPLQDEDSDKSITEMEIDCALKSFPYLDCCLFYFRDPVDYSKDPDAQKLYVSTGREKNKLTALKKRLSDLCPDCVHTYRATWDEEKSQIEGLEAFAALLLENIKQVLESEFRGELAAADKLSESINIQDSYIGDRARTFSGRKEELKAIGEFVSSADRRLLVIRGDSGCGKSSLMAKFVSEGAGGACILPFFVGADGMSFTVENMIRSVICRVSRILGVPLCFDADSDEFDGEKMLREFNNLLNALSAERTVVLAIDALNQFEKTLYEEKLGWLNLYALDPRVKLVFSVTTDYPQSKILSSLGAEFFGLNYLSDEDIITISRHYFAANHRELNEDILREIVGKENGKSQRSCREPIYLLTLLQEMDSLGKEDFRNIKRREAELKETPAAAIVGYLKDIVISAPAELEDLLDAFYRNCAEKLGEETCELYVSAIALSRRGLNERLMERLSLLLNIPFEGAAFSYFRKLFKNHLCQRENAFWDFNHALIKQYFRDRTPAAVKERIIGAMVDCLTQEADDSRFKLTEYAYYLRLSRAFEQFAPYFARMSADPLVRDSLLEELQKAGDPSELKKLLSDPSHAPVIRSFIESTVRRSAFRYELGEAYSLCALRSVYTDGTDGEAFREVTGIYDALACAAEQAGRYALAKDYFLLAVRVAKKRVPDLSLASFYRHIARCSFKLGQVFAGRRYRRLAERALEERSAVSAEELLRTYDENCRTKLDELVVDRAPVRRYAEKMLAVAQRAEESGELSGPRVLLWSSRILYLASHTKGAETFEPLAVRCGAQTTGDPLTDAEIAYHLGMYRSDTDLKAAQQCFVRAHALAEQAIRTNSADVDALRLMAKICEMQGCFAALAKEDTAPLLKEERDVLGRLLTVEPTYAAAQGYLDCVGRGDAPLKKEAKHIRRISSRGELTANQKALHKIFLLIVFGVTMAFLIVMPLMFSVFRGAAAYFFPTANSYFKLFFTFYIAAAFETFLNLFFCFGAYSLLQVLRPTSGYTERKAWLKKATGFLVAFGVLLGSYAPFWDWGYGVFLFDVRFAPAELCTVILLASGIMLAVMIAHETYTFIAHERTIRPAALNIKRLQREGSRTLWGFAVDAAFLVGVVLMYCLGALFYIRAGMADLTAFSAPIFVFPTTVFGIVAGAAGLLLAVKFVRMLILVIGGRRRYAKAFED